jgi:hypothetical protein
MTAEICVFLLVSPKLFLLTTWSITQGSSIIATYLFQIHGLHGSIHAFYHIGHTTRDLAHRHSRLDLTGDSIDPRSQAQQVELLVLLADGVLGVDFGNVAVVLLDGLFQFCLFGVFVLAGFGGLAVELFGGELEEECVSGGDGYDGRCGGVVEGWVPSG